MNRILKVGKKEPEAYVIDRVGYDKFLAEQAVKAGADLFLHHKVNHLDVKTGEIIVGSNGKNLFRSKIIVGEMVTHPSLPETSIHHLGMFRLPNILLMWVMTV